MIKNSIPFLVAVLFFMACSNAEKTDKTYQQSSEILNDVESKNPAKFLTITASDRKNLLGQTVVKGTLQSKAKVHTYKDVEIELSFYSKTKALLEQDKEVIYEEINPGSVKKFKTKYFAPKGTDSIALRVVNAGE